MLMLLQLQQQLGHLLVLHHHSPTPVEYGPVELDVDNEVHGDDDYMSPPDASGNKRELEVEK
jgi:hypothetical protein